MSHKIIKRVKIKEDLEEQVKEYQVFTTAKKTFIGGHLFPPTVELEVVLALGEVFLNPRYCLSL